MKLSPPRLALLLLACLGIACVPAAAPRATLVIVGGTLIGVAGGDPIENSVVVIQNDRIVLAGPQSHTPYPKDGEVIDARGMWIIPGVINDGIAHDFGVPGENRTVSQGQPADLSIYETNPLTDTSETRRIAKVIRKGIVHDFADAVRLQQQ